jgi:hypothetical protein
MRVSDGGYQRLVFGNDSHFRPAQTALDDPWLSEKDRTPEDGLMGKRPAKGAGRLNSNRIARVRLNPFY